MNLIFWSISLRSTPTLFCFRDCLLFIGLWMIFLYQTSQMFSKSLWYMLLLMDPEKVKDYQFSHIASIIVLSFKFSASVFFFFLVQSLCRSPSLTSRNFFCLVLAFIFLSMEIFNSHESYYIFNTTYFVVTNIHFQISPKIIVYWNKTSFSSIKSLIINAFTTSCFGDIQHLHEILQHQIAMGDIQELHHSLQAKNCNLVW